MSSLDFKRLMFGLTSGQTLIQEGQAQILGDTQILLEPPSYLIRFSADFLWLRLSPLKKSINHNTQNRQATAH